MCIRDRVCTIGFHMLAFFIIQNLLNVVTECNIDLIKKVNNPMLMVYNKPTKLSSNLSVKSLTDDITDGLMMEIFNTHYPN